MANIAAVRQQVQVCIGKAGLPVGSLVYVRQGRRENCAFAMGRRSTPQLIELEHIYQASRAVERGQESAEDLRYLQGRGTSLDGGDEYSAVSGIRSPFKKEALRQDGGGNVLDVLRRHAAGEEAISPLPDDCHHVVDRLTRLFSRQAEPPRLRQQVVDAGRAAVASHGQCEVASFKADHGRGHQVIGGRKPPALLSAQQGMVTRVIVVIGHRRIEDHPAKQFGAIGFGLIGPPAQVVRQ